MKLTADLELATAPLIASTLLSGLAFGYSLNEDVESAIRAMDEALQKIPESQLYTKAMTLHRKAEILLSHNRLSDALATALASETIVKSLHGNSEKIDNLMLRIRTANPE